MHKNYITIKVAAGYCAIAFTLVLAISLVYSNTKSILAINEASRQYIQQKEATDSTMSVLLQEEQRNLKNLSDALEGKEEGKNFLQEKAKNLNTGKDSIMVHTKAPQTHEEKSTTVEVVKTRKGFLRRLADVFHKERAETLSVKRDSDRAVVDSITTPVNVAEDVADILEQIGQKEKHASHHDQRSIDRKLDRLRRANAKLALQSAQRANDLHQQERTTMQQAIRKAMEARKNLLSQMLLLTLLTITAIIVLVWRIWRDARRERIYRENLEAANAETRRIMAQRERLLLTITHDIKAPAASISGFIDLMGRYVHAQQGIDCLDNIKQSARHLSQLVASLLDFHQLENGQMKIHSSPFSPLQLARESVEAMRLRADENGLKMTLEEKETPTLVKEYQGDAFRIRQILDNLLGNAIKYTNCGSITVGVGINIPSQAPEKALLTLSVKDTGKGMTSEERRKAFQPFTRLENAQGIEGTGLGLAITRELTSLLGGEIQVSSTPGKGSTFTVVIPLEKSQANARKEREANSERPMMEGKKILLLDDDKLQLQLLQEMLLRLTEGRGKDSFQVFACSHVGEALTILHNERPSLMLMDIEMPEMSGTEMVSHINHTGMKVVAMTAHDHSIKPSLLEAGFDDCLFKPFGMERLAKVLGLEYHPEEKAAPSASILAFADGDEEAEREIQRMVDEELAAHLQELESAVCQSPLPLDRISQTAHKLLPLAALTELSCQEQIKALRPEQIHELGEEKARNLIQEVIREMRRWH